MREMGMDLKIFTENIVEKALELNPIGVRAKLSAVNVGHSYRLKNTK